MFKKMRTTLVAVLVGLLLVTTGCGSSGSSAKTTPPAGGSTAGSPAVKEGGTLNIALSSDAPKLDPSLSSSVYDRYVFQSLFDKLFDLDKAGKIVPVLVKEYDVSADGKVYNFKLREGVKFQDGTDFNAEAVKFNFARNMENASPRKNELGAVKAVTVVDPLTVKIELTQAFAPFLSILTDRAGMMVSPEAVKKSGDEFANNPVGTGPFSFKEKIKGTSITLVKNPNYWQKGLPHLDQVVYKIITDSNVAALNMKSGQIDMTDWRFPTKEIPNFSKDPNYTIINEPGQGYTGFYVNVNKPPFDNKYIRQALDVLMDREAIVKIVKNNAATPAHQPFPPANFAHNKSDVAPKPDVAKAKELLAKGGKPDGFSFTYKTGTTPENQQIGEMLQTMFKQAGINMTIEKIEFGTLLDQAKKANFEAVALGWSGRPDPDQNIYDDVVTSASLNYAGYSNPQVDKLMKDARIELDPAKRTAIYNDAMKIVNDELPYIYFYFENNVLGLTNKVKNFEYVSDGLIRTAKMSKE